MARRSRLKAVRQRRATRQGWFYLVLALGAGFAIFYWGISALAKFAALFFEDKAEPFVQTSSELRPTPPVLFGIPESQQESTVNIDGLAQEGMEVVLYVNNREEDRQVTSDNGSFSFNGVALDEGKNFLYAISMSGDGQESEKSKTYNLLVDSTKPELIISSPEDGKVYRGEYERLVTVEGLVDEDVVQVRVNDRRAIVTTENAFSLQYSLSEGDQVITVVAKDRAGNEVTKELSVRWEP